MREGAAIRNPPELCGVLGTEALPWESQFGPALSESCKASRRAEGWGAAVQRGPEEGRGEVELRLVFPSPAGFTLPSLPPTSSSAWCFLSLSSSAPLGAHVSQWPLQPSGFSTSGCWRVRWGGLTYLCVRPRLCQEGPWQRREDQLVQQRIWNSILHP